MSDNEILTIIIIVASFFFVLGLGLLNLFHRVSDLEEKERIRYNKSQDKIF